MNYTAIIQRGLDMIEDNLQADITAEELAQQAGFSLYHYYRLFQSATGLPVGQYILRRRLLHAIYEIHGGRKGVDAALAYGFDTYAGFYKAFRREFDCTPAQFRRARRAGKPWRLELNKEEHMTVTHKKAARILQNWGLEGMQITDIHYQGTGGKNENACYVGDEWVLKYTSNPGKMHNHMALSRAIAGAGLNAATPCPALDGREWVQDGETYFFLTRRLAGAQLAADDLYGPDGQRMAEFVGGIIGRLHTALKDVEQCVNDADTLSAVRDWAMPALLEAGVLPEDFCNVYMERFGRLYPQLPRQIIHRDPNPGNIITDGSSWGFIDFELSERNVRIFDPCYAATAILSENLGRDDRHWLEICRWIMAGYDRAVWLTEAEREVIPYVILANQLVSTAWFASQPKFAALYETNRRMTLWLMEHLDELRP